MVGRIEFNEAIKKLAVLRETTIDGKYTGKDLLHKVRQTVNVTNCNDKNGLYKYITDSFSSRGLLDTYNDLGECRWNSMIRKMINHELQEASW